MRARPPLLLTLGLALVLAPADASAQRIGARPPEAGMPGAGAATFRDSLSAMPVRARLRAPSLAHRDSSWWVPLTSMVLPGAGQVLLGQDRFLAYLAVEGYSLISLLDRSGEERRQRDYSRSLANNVARAFVPGVRPLGDWHYYENMEKYIESGVFDRGVPGGDFQPEVDVTTYNGSLWLDVRARWWNDPNVEPSHSSSEYRNSLNEYLARAYRPEMRWSWRNAQLEQDLYRQTIRKKNDAHHDATLQLGVLAANHLLSTIDAFVTLRVRGGGGVGGPPPALSVAVPWAPFGRGGGR